MRREVWDWVVCHHPNQVVLHGDQGEGNVLYPFCFWVEGEDWVSVGAYEDFPGAGGDLDGRLYAGVVEVGDRESGIAEVKGYWLRWGVFDILAFGYREEGADLADAFAGLDECVAGDAFAGAGPYEERGGRGFGDGSEGLSWPITSLKVCERCAVAVF